VDEGGEGFYIAQSRRRAELLVAPRGGVLGTWGAVERTLKTAPRATVFCRFFAGAADKNEINA
jgi:hypothetical protein